jgi:hypothetical protein
MAAMLRRTRWYCAWRSAPAIHRPQSIVAAAQKFSRQGLNFEIFICCATLIEVTHALRNNHHAHCDVSSEVGNVAEARATIAEIS